MWEEDKKTPSFNREFNPSHWGSAFQHLPKLKYLTIEFETEKGCEAQIDAIVEHAKAWKFPMGKRGSLNAEESEVQKWEWEGPLCMRNNTQRFGIQQLHPNLLAIPTFPVSVSNSQTSQASSQAISPSTMPRLRHLGDGINEEALKPILVGRTVRWNLAPI